MQKDCSGMPMEKRTAYADEVMQLCDHIGYSIKYNETREDTPEKQNRAEALAWLHEKVFMLLREIW